MYNWIPDSGTRHQVLSFSIRLLALLALAADSRKVLSGRSMSLGAIFEGKDLTELKQVSDLMYLMKYVIMHLVK